jgi:transcriptional antiterminator NusG
LTQRIEANNLEDKIVEIFVPIQKKIVVKKGKQDIKEDKLFPGYVLVKMELNERTWDIVQNTEGVRGFVKTDRYPRPLPESEVQAIMKFMEVEQPSYQTSFSVGEAVKIMDGAFADFIGSVQEIDTSKGKIKVLISFLGREAPVELDFSQVSKL